MTTLKMLAIKFYHDIYIWCYTLRSSKFVCFNQTDAQSRKFFTFGRLFTFFWLFYILIVIKWWQTTFTLLHFQVVLLSALQPARFLFLLSAATANSTGGQAQVYSFIKSLMGTGEQIEMVPDCGGARFRAW